MASDQSPGAAFAGAACRAEVGLGVVGSISLREKNKFHVMNPGQLCYLGSWTPGQGPSQQLPLNHQHSADGRFLMHPFSLGKGQVWARAWVVDGCTD